jgi:hypothetical protein
MAKQLRYDLGIPPQEALARLASATAALGDLTDLGSPLRSYGRFLKESFLGPKEYAAEVGGQSFRVVPIGAWPLKGSLAASAGAMGSMRGDVRETAYGSRLEARYVLAPWVTRFPVAFGCVLALIGAAVLTMARGEGVAPRDRVIALVILGGMALFFLLFLAALLLAARAQRRGITAFLERLYRDEWVSPG